MVEQSNFKIEKIKSMAVGLQSYLWPCRDNSDGKIDLYHVPCVPFCPNWIGAYTDNIGSMQNLVGFWISHIRRTA